MASRMLALLSKGFKMAKTKKTTVKKTEKKTQPAQPQETMQAYRYPSVTPCRHPVCRSNGVLMLDDSGRWVKAVVVTHTYQRYRYMKCRRCGMTFTQGGEMI
jgi:hypothetical protein